ncbi:MULTISPECIES: recombinase family protein [Microbacterium]|uniref:recombinase family protein n=1 Tax=Microbacterium aurum TaxID=36805 RepID=UPI001EF6FB7D|nr:recombinase family protein [Microbacterium aurum]
MIVGYARVSTVEQDVETQRRALLELGVAEDRIYTDRGFSGKTMTRHGLDQALAAVREGDRFIVPRLDRLARNVEGALDVMRQLTDRGVIFQNGSQVYDPHDPMSKMVMTILAAVAEAEGGWISHRTKEAMARPAVRAKLRGRQPSLKPATDAEIVAQLEAGDKSVAQIAETFRTSRSGVYRAAARHRQRTGKITAD